MKFIIEIVLLLSYLNSSFAYSTNHLSIFQRKLTYIKQFDAKKNSNFDNLPSKSKDSMISLR